MMRDLGWWYWVLTVGLLGAGLDNGDCSGDGLVRRPNRACAVAHAKPHCLPLAGAGRLPCDADRGIVGSVAVDPLDATGRNKCQGLDRLLLVGEDIVASAMESLAVIVVGTDHAHVLLVSNTRAGLRRSVSPNVARASAEMNWESF